MAIIHFVNYHGGQSGRAVEAVLDYIMQDTKTVEDGQKYVTGINCCPESAVTEFRNTKRLYRKEDGMQFFHLVQSFPPWEQITPMEAHQIALEFAEKCEKLSGFEVVAATHCDPDHNG